MYANTPELIMLQRGRPKNNISLRELLLPPQTLSSVPSLSRSSSSFPSLFSVCTLYPARLLSYSSLYVNSSTYVATFFYPSLLYFLLCILSRINIRKIEHLQSQQLTLCVPLQFQIKKQCRVLKNTIDIPSMHKSPSHKS